MSKLGRLSKQKSVMNIEANPLESGNLQATAMKVESLSDCVQISPGDFSSFLSRLIALEANEERLKVIEEAKIPYLFASEQLLKMLDITTSIKTKIQMIAQIGPRLVDPKAKTQQFLDLFRYADEKTQVEEILKARSQALVSSQFSTASTVGAGRGGGRGGLLAGRGGGRGGAGRGSAASSGNTRPVPAVSNETATEPTPNAPVAPSPAGTAAFATPPKKLEVSISAENVFSPSSAASTPGGNETVVSDIHDVFNFLDTAGTMSARSSRRITMDTIDERADDMDEEDSEEDEEDENCKSVSQLGLLDDTSLTTTETMPSVSTVTSSPYIRSQLPTNGSMAHNLSDGSMTEGGVVDSKAADAAVALIAAIVAKENVVGDKDSKPNNNSSNNSNAVPTPVTAEGTTTSSAAVTTSATMTSTTASVTDESDNITSSSSTTSTNASAASEVVVAVEVRGGKDGCGLLLPPLSRPNSLRLDESALDDVKQQQQQQMQQPEDNTSALDLSARPRSMSNPSSARSSKYGSFLGSLSNDGTAGAAGSSSAPASFERTSLLKQSLHHSSFTLYGSASHRASRDEELQAVASASSQIRQLAAKVFSGGDKSDGSGHVPAPTMRGVQRTRSEMISKELSRSSGSIQVHPSSHGNGTLSSSSSFVGMPKLNAVGGNSSSSSSNSASDDLAQRYAGVAKLSKDDFLALTVSEAVGVSDSGEPLFTYHELLRRNFRKDYGDLKHVDLQRYLVDNEFEQVFSKSKVEFEAQAKWRQVDQKKKAMLF